MNFITFDSAYSLYPSATFQHRLNLVLKHDTPKDMKCITKYANRGWHPVFNNHEPQHRVPDTFYVDVDRFVGDKKCWKVPLDIAGLARRPRSSATSEEINWDPVIPNSWLLRTNSTTHKIVPFFFLVKSWVFRFTYLCSSSFVHDALTSFGSSQSQLQWQCGKTFTATSPPNSWTWYVQVLPIRATPTLSTFRWDSIVPELLQNL